MSRLRIMQMTAEELERRQKDGTLYADLVPIGKWETTAFSDRYICSECKHDLVTQYKPYDFCPWCGADMREGDVE